MISRIATLFFLAFVTTTFAHNTATKDNETFTIEQMDQELEFFLNKEKELNARLKVSIIVRSNSSLNNTFKRAVFFDNNSEVEIKTLKYGNQKKMRKPIYTDYETDGIFHSDLKMCLSEQLMEGKEKTLEFIYEKTYTDIKFLDPLYFNDMYTVKSSQIAIEVPEWLDINLVEWNFDKEQPKKSVEAKKKSKVYTYVLDNVAPIGKFRSQPRRNKINAHIICLPKSMTYKDKKKEFIQDTGDLYGWYSSLVNTMENNTSVLQDKVDELTAGLTDDKEKIKKIYYWVQDNIRYIAFEYGLMGFQPEACQSVYNNKYGDCKGMANLTKEMLKLAGYDARLTWIGTNDLPYTYDLPSLIVDNHMICTVIINGERIFLDATEKYSDLGVYAHRIQGKQVLIEDGKEYIIDQIPVSDYKMNKEETVHEFSIEDNSKLVGTGNLSLSGNRISWLKYIMSGIPEKDWDRTLRKYIGNSDKNVNLSILEDPNIKSRDEDLSISYAISIDNNITNIGSEMYINPEVDYHLKGFELEDDRTVAYEFSKKYFIKNTTVINIPEGWKSTYLPEKVNLENDDFAFNLEYTENEGKIVYSKVLEVKNDLLEPDKFSNWKEAIEALKTFYEDQIILSK